MGGRARHAARVEVAKKLVHGPAKLVAKAEQPATSRSSTSTTSATPSLLSHPPASSNHARHGRRRPKTLCAHPAHHAPHERSPPQRKGALDLIHLPLHVRTALTRHHSGIAACRRCSSAPAWASPSASSSPSSSSSDARGQLSSGSDSAPDARGKNVTTSVDSTLA